MKTSDLLEFDRAVGGVIAGIDEVGRGSLAGPVYAACCVMPQDCMIDGIDDSKNLSPRHRRDLYDKIVSSAICYSVCSVPCEIIDEINILQATKRAMLECVRTLTVTPDKILVDAVKLDIPNAIPIIKGDSKSYAIAAASIIAKVTRDTYMENLSREYPEYLFAKNKGYGTREHIEAIKKLGPSCVHRRTFIRNFTEVKI